MILMPNYSQYSKLLEEYSKEDLDLAFNAIHCSDTQDGLYEDESPLLVFLLDTEKQEQLFLYHEDLELKNLEISEN